MFTRVFALLPLALLASASYLKARDGCSTGPIDCCNSVQSYSESTQILSALNIVLANVDANTPLGFNCSPLSVIGVAGNSCTGQTVCCDHNNFNGLVNVGCTPVNVNL